MNDELGNDSQVFKYFMKLEELAEDIIADKETLAKLDAKRNGMREAMRALQHQEKKNPKDTKSWICIRDMFVKIPREKALSYVTEEQKSVEEEIKNIRNNLKIKVDILHELEGKPGINPGYYLNPLSQADMAVLGL